MIVAHGVCAPNKLEPVNEERFILLLMFLVLVTGFTGGSMMGGLFT